MRLLKSCEIYCYSYSNETIRSQICDSRKVWQVVTKLWEVLKLPLIIVNSLWPSDARWWHSTGSTFAQEMACCLLAPSHYLYRCWFISGVRSSDIHLRAITKEMPQQSIIKISLKIIHLKYHSNLPGANELSMILSSQIIWFGPCLNVFSTWQTNGNKYN